jgi:hypothetical protein
MHVDDRIATTVVIGEGAHLSIVQGLAATLPADGGLAVVGANATTELVPRDVLTAEIGVGDGLVATAETTARLDLVDALRVVHQRKHRPRRALVVGEPGSDPLLLVQTIVADPFVNRVFRLDGVVTAVDGPQMSTRLAAGLPMAEGSALIGLTIADRIAVAQGHLITRAADARIRAQLEHINGTGAVRVPRRERTEIAWFVDLDAWFGALPVRHDLYSTPPSGDTDDVTALELRCDDELDPEGLDAWCDRLRSTSELWRMQGVVRLADRHGSTACVGVRDFMAGSPTTGKELHGDPCGCVAHGLTIVGRGVRSTEVIEGFREILR